MKKRESEGGEDANEVFMLENLIRELKIWQVGQVGCWASAAEHRTWKLYDVKLMCTKFEDKTCNTRFKEPAVYGIRLESSSDTAEKKKRFQWKQITMDNN